MRLPFFVPEKNSNLFGLDDKGSPFIYRPEGGILTKLHNAEMPFPGYIPQATRDYIGAFKQIFIIPFLMLKQESKTGQIMFAAKMLLFFHYRRLRNLFFIGVYMFKKALKLGDHIPTKPRHLCRSGREVWRVMDILIGSEKDERLKKQWQDLRDALVCVMEYDSAYRFRLQRIMSQIDPKEFQLDEYDDFWARKITLFDWDYNSDKNTKNES